MIPWNSIIGGAMDLAGTAIMAGGADERKKAQQDIANTPGINFGSLTGEALAGYNQNYSGALGLASKLSKDQQALLTAQEEQALPGIGAARAKALGRVGSLFDEDSAWLKGVQRRGAALGLSSGLRGSSAGQLQTLRLSDQEQMQRTQLGTGLLGSLIGSMRMANTPGVQAFLGPSISDQLNTRSLERTQRMAMQSAAAGMPSGLETWGQRLQQAGSTLAGSGMLGMGGGGGFSGSSTQTGLNMQGYNQMLESGDAGSGMLMSSGYYS